MVALRIELSATRLSAVSWQPALDYRLSRAPRSRTRPRRSRKQNHCLLLPKQACYHLHLCPISCLCKSERLDSNQRSPGPGPSAITRLRYVLFRLVCSSSCGSRTQPARLERPMTSPEVERAVLCAHCERRSGPGGARTLVCGASDRRRPCCAWCPRLSYQPKSWSGHEKTRCHFHL